jgi:hypothetical protein
MSNTPETDKAERMAYSQEYMVPTEFARKLERERDEARDIGEKLSKQGLDMMDKNRSLIQELDKAIEALMKIEDLFIDGEDIYADRESMGMIAKNALEEIK